MFGTLQTPKLQIGTGSSTGFSGAQTGIKTKPQALLPGAQTGITTKPQALLHSGLGTFRFAAPKRIAGSSPPLAQNVGGAQILSQNQNINTPRLPEGARNPAASNVHPSNLSAQTTTSETDTQVLVDSEIKNGIGLNNELKLVKVDNRVPRASAEYTGANVNGKLSSVQEDKVLEKPLTRHESGFTTAASDQVISSLMASSQTTIGLNSEKEPQPPEEKAKETLYRCALCGDLVFQNQLEEHVKECPEDKNRAGLETKDEPAVEEERDGVSSRDSTEHSYLIAEEKDIVLDQENAESTPSPAKQSIYPCVSTIKLSDVVDEGDDEQDANIPAEEPVHRAPTESSSEQRKAAGATLAFGQPERERPFTDAPPAARQSDGAKTFPLGRQCVSYSRTQKSGNVKKSPPMRQTLPNPVSPKTVKSKSPTAVRKTLPASPTHKAHVVKTSPQKRKSLPHASSPKTVKEKNSTMARTTLPNPGTHKTVDATTKEVAQDRAIAVGPANRKEDVPLTPTTATAPEPTQEASTRVQKKSDPNAKPPLTARGTRNVNQKNNKPLARARSEEPKRKWTGWAESDIATHTMQTAERKIRTVDKLSKELSSKIEEECTFAPKLCEMSQKMQLSRADFHESLAKQEEVKARHLEEIRGTAYAEATHRPIISNKAKNLYESRKLRDQVESADELYQRLYSSNLRTPRKEEPAPTFQPNISASSSSAMNQRDLPTTTLLYSDALERRTRRQQAIEEVDREVKQMKNQILPKSRKYYWTMLEKQIKTAFDRVCTASHATAGHPYILFEHLDYFLVELGCLPLVISEDEALDRHIKLKQSLWTHLDPHKKGGVDIITVTVFFHLLMGAVETSPANCEEDVHALYLAGTSAPGAMASLESIEEEEDGAAAPEDSIEQIVKRFDPRRLRQEFHTLYSNRLHYVKTNGQKTDADASTNEHLKDEHFASERRGNATAKALGDNAHKKMKARAGNTQMSHVQLLFVRKQMQDERLRKIRLQAAQEEDDSCPFQPNVSATMMYNLQRNVEVNPRLRLAKLHTDLFAQAKWRNQRMEEVRRQHAKKKVQKEMENCSFTPDTSASEKTYYAVKNTVFHVPRGFDLTTSRLRNAYLERRQREMNLATVTEQFPTKNYAKIALRAKPFLLQTEKRASMTNYRERPRSESLQPPKRKPTVSTREHGNRDGVALTDHLPVRGRQLGTAQKSTRGTSLPPQSMVDGKELGSAVPQEDDKEEEEEEDATSTPKEIVESDVLLFVDVNITPEKTARLIVYKDQSVEEAASSFAAEHNLTEQLSQKLQYLLGLQMEQLQNEK
eukprot:GEMP01004198.1.p1 GENE.GEMP01004198.1~~GEMP01004198.1.p1  ORF type:complete len:1308 (+),score=346.12 GEMP01004198.1:56-3979(+)